MAQDWQELTSLTRHEPFVVERVRLTRADIAITGSFDHVAMDIKLASATGEPTDWEAHRRFLELAPRGATQVKAVIASATADEELRRVAELVASVDAATPVVLQPVTPVGGVVPPSPQRMLAFQRELLARLPDVRVIPQVHKLMGQK